MGKQTRRIIKYIANLAVFVIALVLCITLLPKLIIFFMPFVIGWIISCIANPLVSWLESKIKIKKKAGTVVVIVAVLALVCWLGYTVAVILFRQISGFINDMPIVWQTFSNGFSNFGNTVSKTFVKLSPKWTDALNTIGDFIGDFISGITSNAEKSSITSVTSIVGNVASMIIATIMCLLSAYFFIADRDYVHKTITRIIPLRMRSKYELFINSIKQAVGGYFKAQFKIEIWIYILLVIGLYVLKIRYALLIALIIAFLDFLPFFGSGTVLWPWAVLVLLSGDYVRAIGFVVIWGITQLVRQFIQPKIMGDSIGLQPIPTLFLLYIGYKIGGVGGMIIAIPVGIVVVNMNEAGIFDDAKNSMRLLMKNLNSFRKIDDEDLTELKNNDE